MTTAEEKYKDIINKRWDADPAFFRKHPRMSLENRAKIFAPFAALRGHKDRLSQESDRLLSTKRVELSDEEASALSAKLRHLNKGMEITVIYFDTASDNSEDGYYTSLSGTVSSIDLIYRLLKIDTGKKGEKGEIIENIKFCDLFDIRISEVN